jgi:gliding motility-associated-like protein
MKPISLIFLICLIFVGNQVAEGQYLANPSFESLPPNPHVPPPGWYSCEEQSTPDVHGENGYLQSFEFHLIDHSPSHGDTYIALKLRGKDYKNLPNTREHVSTALQMPLKKNNCYIVQIDLTYEEEVLMNSESDVNTTYPTLLDIWGGKDSCARSELLCKSSLVNHQDWRTYTLWIKPSEDYNYLTLAPNWKNEDSTKYNGCMMMDNMKIIHLVGDTAKPVAEYNYYFKVYDEIILDPQFLEPSSGTEYYWFPKDGLSCYDCANPLLEEYVHDTYFVRVTDEFGCISYEKFNIHYHCDSVYNIQNKLMLDTIVGIEHNVQLTASASDSYKWTPGENLSCTGCRATDVLNSAHGSFYVELFDKYGCSYLEEYRIKTVDCDTMVRNNQVMDTTIIAGDAIELTASESAMDYSWNFPEDLSCPSCRVTSALPDYSKIYETRIKDDWGCIFTEQFKVTVDIYVPNVITPNGDGKNDVFKIPGLPPYCKLTIVDRNGRMIFRSDNYQNNWDAKDLDNKNVEGGTYWYLLEIPETEEIQKGFVFVQW